jgi:hypothetical protein
VAVAHLSRPDVSVCDSPEELSPDITGQEWEFVSELAVQIRSNNSDRVHSAFMPLDIAAEARSWRDSHGGPGETTPEQIFCLQLLTERMRRAAARNRRSEIVRVNCDSLDGYIW